MQIAPPSMSLPTVKLHRGSGAEQADQQNQVDADQNRECDSKTRESPSRHVISHGSPDASAPHHNRKRDEKQRQEIDQPADGGKQPHIAVPKTQGVSNHRSVDVVEGELVDWGTSARSSSDRNFYRLSNSPAAEAATGVIDGVAATRF